MRSAIRLAVLTSAMAFSGCANITPTLIDAGDGSMKDGGLRYYETRPFIVVKEPYPIGSKAFLVSGRVAGDGKTVMLTAVPDELRVLVPMQLEGGGSVPAASVLIAHQDVRDQVDAHGAEGAAGDKPEEEGAQDGKEDEGDEPKDPATKRMGLSNISVTTDLAALARFELSKSISLIYLPDYEREFIVDTKSKLGTTRLTLNLGPGSSLLGMSGDVDNSVVVEALLDSTKALLTGGTDRLLGLVTGSKDSGTGGGVVAHSAAGELAKLAGQPVTLRAHLVKIAAMGMYPIVKPSEVGGYHPQTPYQTERRFVLPVAGYQIPYDYYEVLVFEHVLGSSTGGLLSTSPASGDATGNATPDCSGKIKPDDMDDWWDKEVAGAADATEKARMGQLDVEPKASAGKECYDAADIRVRAKAGSPAATETDRAKVEAAFKKRFPKTTVKVVLG